MKSSVTVQHVSGSSTYFEWDSDKAHRNQLKHDVSFEQASSAFDDTYALITYDVLHSEMEDRYQLLGMANGTLLLLVVFTERDAVRIISARKANDKETKRYAKHRRTFT